MNLDFYADNYYGAERFLKHFCLQKKAPALPFLSELTRVFCKIPYENATKLLKVRSGAEGAKRLRLPEEVLEDYLRFGAGGTCFSLTFFFHTILKNLGFESYPVMGDRSYGMNTHCALIVDFVGEKFLVDPGFLVDQPIALDPLQDTVLRTAFNTIIVSPSPSDQNYHFYTIHQNNKKWRYRLKIKPVDWEEFYRHWTDSFSWSGLNSVVITAVMGGRQIYFRDNHLRIVAPDQVLRQTVKNPSELETIFGIHAPLLCQALESIPSSGDSSVDRIQNEAKI
ncbi:MAG: arylamine N-acetyltransferase [Deltaproteobacteria bacterium]|nr:arylamine N-acetyltransferase [Deltaproteobacteria bacterium]